MFWESLQILPSSTAIGHVGLATEPSPSKGLGAEAVLPRTLGSTTETDLDTRLGTDFVKPGWQLHREDKIVLESKEAMKARGVDPRDADADMLAFAAPVKVGNPPYAVPSHRQVRP